MGLFNSILIWFLRKRIEQIRHMMDYPLETQQRVLTDLLERSSSTEWGKRFGYKDIKSIESYRQRVPVQDYESIKPWIERIIQGEQRLLWPTEIRWFAKSSGTTSDKSKFIPVSRESMEDCHFAGGKDVVTMYVNHQPKTEIFTGKGLVMGGSTQVNKLSSNSYIGDVSAVMMKNMPLWAQWIRTPNESIALMDDWEMKIQRMAEETMRKNVTHLAGVPTWTIVLIRKLFEMTGKDNLRDIWPNLELYIHGGVSFTPYREQFAEVIRGEGMHYLETYNASEGFFAIQDDQRRDDLLLMLDYGMFYEFIPVEEVHKENPRTLWLEEVQLDTVYALMISTNAGLWRYMVGDTIRFTSLSPHRIKIAGRVKHFINAFGEEVVVDNTDRAIATACQEFGCTVVDYTVAPIWLHGNDKGGHEWIIEFGRQPENLEAFTAMLDAELQKLNSDYEAKRYKSLALAMPTVHAARENLFRDWLEKNGKLGGQHKVPRLSNDRRYVDDILPML